MATYLQGVQDAVQSLRPPDPQLQFDAQMLSTRQSKYDQGHAKLSKMYGTILNSGLTRDENIAAREEFFKLIESDLQKVAGMDLSKDSNVSKARNVFKQIYTNDHLVKDMVWTKHYQEQMQRAEGFKNCKDSDECGGSYWEDGVKYMQYKREEFKNAGQDESLSYGNVDYIPNNNLMADALEQFKELDPEAKAISYTPDGKYRITYTNGKVIEEPLQDFFGQLYANDPKFMDTYKVMAYNSRKDEIYASISDGTYKDLNSATVGYIENYRDEVQADFDKRSEKITHNYDELKTLNEAYAKDIKSGKIKERNSKGEYTKEYLLANQTAELFNKAGQLKGWNDRVKSAQKNLHNQSNREYITDYMDNLNSMTIFSNEVDLAAQTLSKLTAQEEWEPDEYAMADYKHVHALQLQSREFAHDEEMARIKANDAKLDFKSNAFTAAGTFHGLLNEVNVLESNKYTEAAKKLSGALGEKAASYIGPNMSPTNWNNLKVAFGPDVGVLTTALHDVEIEIINKKQSANEALFKTLDYASRYGPGIKLDLKVDPSKAIYDDVYTWTDGDGNTQQTESLNKPQIQSLAAWSVQYKGVSEFQIFSDVGAQLLEPNNPYGDYYNDMLNEYENK